jgi:RimJ/RimL family protein N-acetyltransferase
MILMNEKVILREFIEPDIEDFIRWETVETEWQLWDAPWENDETNRFSPEAYRKKMEAYLSKPKKTNSLLKTLQICINNDQKTHIGWCNSYYINEKFEYSISEGFCTIGINIPVEKARRKGYASAALKLLIEYYLSNGIEDIYTQTWSGNERVLGLMRKLGFEECNRNINSRQVRGNLFDGLTFRLNKNRFYERQNTP